MKVLLIATDLFFKGGVQRYARYQHKALCQIFGKENVYLTSLCGKRDDVFFEEEIETYYVQGGTSILDKIQFVYKNLQIAKQKKIDLIIINHRQLSIIGYLSKKLYNTKYFTNIYGLEIWSGMSRVETFALLKSDKLIGDCNFIIDYIKIIITTTG